jgi:hypothetical protein
MAVREVQVYVVEVCRGCSWNHLVEQFLIGRATLPEPAPIGELASRTSGLGERGVLAVGGQSPTASRGGRTTRRHRLAAREAAE